MKIAVSVKENDPETVLDPRFGRCNYFWIQDLANGTHDCVENSAANDSGGAGTAAAKIVSDLGASAIISGNYGPNAVIALRAFGIKMFVSPEANIATVLDHYNHNRLEEVSQPTREGLHHK